ncbi:hypothetical protein HAX54_048454 [Datura stramonium]|uniref:Uncharacterized protein n=1 Tax=Datura stramonium TaxID=4076 RepID=A0ABS8RHD8_DATST|nr:hypothetical protein [Datura stramonium]
MAMRPPTSSEDSKPMRGYILKGKMPGFRDSLHWQVKGVKRHFQEGLTTTTRGTSKLLIKEAHVPKLDRIDVETYATKKYDLEKLKDESIYDLKLHKQIPEVFRTIAATQLGVESAEMPSVMSRSSQYAFTLENFASMVRKVDRQVKQLKLFAEQLGLFVDRAITASLEPYKNLHARMDDRW